MKDSELAGLDLACAKALHVDAVRQDAAGHPYIPAGDGHRLFMPTSNLTDAMRMAAERDFCIEFWHEYVDVYGEFGDRSQEKYANHSGDKLRACAVAICRAVVASSNGTGNANS